MLFISRLLSSFHRGIQDDATDEGPDKGELSSLSASPCHCNSV